MLVEVPATHTHTHTHLKMLDGPNGSCGHPRHTKEAAHPGKNTHDEQVKVVANLLFQLVLGFVDYQHCQLIFNEDKDSQLCVCICVYMCMSVSVCVCVCVCE